MTDRARFDWKIYSRIWDEVVEYGKSQYGEDADKNGYLVRIIETAMREPLRDNRHAELEEKVYELADAMGVKKSDLEEERIDDPDGFKFESDLYQETTRVVKQVDAALLRRWKKHADQFEESYGEHLSRHLKLFLWGGQPRRLTKQVDRVLKEIERDQDDEMTRTERIADRLDDTFSRDEFFRAAEAEGAGNTAYALSEYLSKVLDETGTYPHPNNPEKFVPRDSDTIPEVLDPSTLPYRAMDETDKRLVIKTSAIQKLKNIQGQNGAKFDADDAVDALDGRPRRSTVRPLLKEIAEDDPDNGFCYDSSSRELRYTQDGVTSSSDINHDALTLALSDGEDLDGNSGDDHKQKADEWVDDAVENLEQMSPDLNEVPDPVINNKIAHAKYPDWRREGAPAQVPTEAVKQITAEDRRKVFEQIYSNANESSDHRNADVTSWSPAMVEYTEDGWVQISPGSGRREAGTDD